MEPQLSAVVVHQLFIVNNQALSYLWCCDQLCDLFTLCCGVKVMEELILGAIYVCWKTKLVGSGIFVSFIFLIQKCVGLIGYFVV